jgi:hypothetical protein
MKRLVVAALVVACAGLVGTTRAADDKDKLAGNWKWTIKTQNGQEREMTLKLKPDGDKLTGIIIGGKNEVKIEEVKQRDGRISFTVTRERNGVKTTTKYEGKVSGDTIKGKIETERDGQTQSREWEAKRSKD